MAPPWTREATHDRPVPETALDAAACRQQAGAAIPAGAGVQAVGSRPPQRPLAHRPDCCHGARRRALPRLTPRRSPSSRCPPNAAPPSSRSTAPGTGGCQRSGRCYARCPIQAITRSSGSPGPSRPARHLGHNLTPRHHRAAAPPCRLPGPRRSHQGDRPFRGCPGREHPPPSQAPPTAGPSPHLPPRAKRRPALIKLLAGHADRKTIRWTFRTPAAGNSTLAAMPRRPERAASIKSACAMTLRILHQSLSQVDKQEVICQDTIDRASMWIWVQGPSVTAAPASSAPRRNAAAGAAQCRSTAAGFRVR
jgi:ferredoxin